MKVLINSNIIWTISNFRSDLIEALCKRGDEVVCVSSRDRFSGASEGILQRLGARFVEIDLDRKGINPLADLRYLWRLYRIYRHEAPDVVLHFTVKPNIYGTLAAAMVGIPSVATVNGLGSGMLGSGVLAVMLKKMYRFAFRYASWVLFQNRDDMGVFLEERLVAPSRCGYVPGSGIDTAVFDGCEKKSGGPLVFLMVARLLRDKGVYEYIEACRKLKEAYSEKVECLLAGVLDDGNPSAIAREELEGWVQEGAVNYLGKTDDIGLFFSQADVVVLPSYREGLSRVLLEAASCRKPIVTTDVPGCRDLVEEGKSGYLCRPGDALSLYEAMVKMLQSSEMLKVMGERGREIVETGFSKEIVNRLYLDTVERVKG